eukprot:scaffold31165_cov137-Skeletonema_menzelii.AAC.1
MSNNNKMANELIVDFPEYSHRYLTCQHRDRMGGSNNADAGDRASRPDHSSLNRQSSYGRSHRHGRPEMSKHLSRSWNDSSNDRCHNDQPRSSDSHPSQAQARTARSVHFAPKSLIYFFLKHEDRKDIDCQDLWYSKSDLALMKLAARKDALEVRDLTASGFPIDYFLGENDDSFICLMGIENCLTNADVIEVKARRERCVLAVLQEQERQQTMDVSSLHFTDWHRQDLIALTSFSQTGKAAKRARELGMLHQACVMDCSS